MALLGGKDQIVDGWLRSAQRIWQPVWDLQKTSVTIAMEEEQNILGNYPNLNMTTNIWAKGDSKVNYLSQWTLKVSPHLLIGKIDISKLFKPPR